jgi:hypothetical protein
LFYEIKLPAWKGGNQLNFAVVGLQFAKITTDDTGDFKNGKRSSQSE